MVRGEVQRSQERDKCPRILIRTAGPTSWYRPKAPIPSVVPPVTGIEMAHVPSKGSAHAINDVVAGHVPLLFSDPAPSVPLIRTGKVRALGVTTLTRWSVAPEIPPLNEAGVPGFDASGWFIVALPEGAPQPIVDKLHAEFKAIM